MKRLKSLRLLFISMLKIGLFTFGGGYAMINLLEHEFVGRRKWIDGDEFADLVTIAESTPGPIAINCSTYIGYKTEKLLGAIVATIAITSMIAIIIPITLSAILLLFSFTFAIFLLLIIYLLITTLTLELAQGHFALP